MVADTMNTATRLAHWIAQPSSPGEDGVALLKKFLLDFIGLAAFGGRFGESSPPLQAILELGGTGGDATVIGEPRGVSPLHAALLNGAHAHTLDFDDTNALATLHPGAPVIAAVFTQAERLHRTGAAFLEALAVGYEVCCRIGDACTAATYDRGFHLTAVAGIFGGVAGAARLAGARAEVVDAALGFAGSRASGSMQYLANGAWNKRYHPGFAAHDALTVLAIAEAGGRGAADIFDGKYGVFTAFTPHAAPEKLLPGLGTEWVMKQTAIKPYPCCRLTHGAIDAARALRERLPGALDQAEVTLRLSPTAYKIVGEPSPHKVAPDNIVDGQFSVYFQSAITLLDGAPGWTSYERIGQPDVQALAARIKVSAEASFAPAECEMTVSSGGHSVSEHVKEPRGEPSRPFTWDDEVDKFMKLAVRVFGEAQSREIVKAVSEVEQVKDMAVFARLLRPRA